MYNLKTILSILLVISVFSISPLTHAQEIDVGKELTNFGKGLTGVKNPKDITGKDVADYVVKDFIGEIPSLTVVNLVEQVRKDFGRHSEQGTNLGYKQCQRAANSVAWSVLGDIRDKGKLAPWAEISWSAIKAIAGGGKSIGDLVKENTKKKVSELLKDWYNGNPPLPKETTTLNHGGRCNTKSVTIWDPEEKRLRIEISGDCGCIDKVTGTGSIGLNNFKVIIEAPVSVEDVTIKEKNRFTFWRSEKIKIFYKVGPLYVNTASVCDRRCPKDTPPPPPEDEKGFISGVWDWFFGDDDIGDPPEDENDDKKDTKEDTDKDREEDARGFIGRVIDKFKKDKEDDTKEPEHEENLVTGVVEIEEGFACGDKVTADGQKGVQTFVYRDKLTDEVNLCDNACAPNQECHVLPESVGAFKDSCTYCRNICAEGQFVEKNTCERSLQDGQECVGSENNSCYAIKNKEKEKDDTPPPVGAGRCEEAVRLLLDEYVGWFDPQLTVRSNGITFTNPEYRCFGNDVLQEHHVNPINKGIQDPDIRAMCPSLEHLGSSENYLSGEGKGRLCETKTEFAF